MEFVKFLFLQRQRQWQRAKMLPRNCQVFRLKYVLLGLLVTFWIFWFLWLFYDGSFTRMFEEDFDTSFDYSLNDSNVPHYAKQLRNGEQPDVQPINTYNYTYNYDCRQKCRDENGSMIVPRLVFIVKSAMNHFSRRSAIRKSWGFEQQYSDAIIRTVFTLGIPNGNTLEQRDLQTAIDREHEQYGDIVQANFIDAYFNNTIKTMMGLRWAIEYCPDSQFFMFVDDDFYISTKNVLRFLRNPINYPKKLEEESGTLRRLYRRLSELTKNQSISNDEASEIKKLIDENSTRTIKAETLTQNERQLPDAEQELILFAGSVFSAKPLRQKYSKWYITLDEYKWNKWPLYIPAGAFLLSREALIQMYYTSMYTKHFRFDDIYLSIVALKANIKPTHSEEFYVDKKNYNGPESYRNVIAMHGYNDPDEMLRVWTELKTSGHA